jgi:voltage-gated potassium channel
MTDRLRRYEDRSSTPLLLLALVFVAVYATVIDPHLPVTARRAMGACSGAIWVAFALDLVVRVVLAERRWRYLATHPVDVAAVVLPALRPLRVLRVFTAGRVPSTGPAGSPSRERRRRSSWQPG